jgi:dihydrodipicolinate synthase/N-acetylneuraminate lyase
VAAARASGRADVALLVGSDTLLVEARRSGGTGSVTAMANLAPATIAALHRAADAEDWPEAEQLQREVVDTRAQLGPGGTARATKQAIAAWLGDYPTAVRAPL